MRVHPVHPLAVVDVCVGVDPGVVEDDDLYGLCLQVFRIDERGNHVNVGYIHLPMEDLASSEVYRQEVYLTKTGEGGGRPVVTVSYAWREGPNVHRERVMRTIKVDYETVLVKEALRKAMDERSVIADLFDQVATDPAKVGAAVTRYFKELKGKEKGYLNGDGVYGGEELVGGEEKKEEGSVYTAMTGGSSGRRRSEHFANDVSMLPKQFSDVPLDVKTLKLLGESVWSPEGKMSTTTKNVKERAAKKHGAVGRSEVETTARIKMGLVEKKEYAADHGVGVGGKKKTVYDGGELKGFMMPTIKEKERVSQGKHDPTFRDLLRGGHDKKVESGAAVMKKERLRSSRNPMIGVKKVTKVEEKRGFKTLERGIGGL